MRKRLRSRFSLQKSLFILPNLITISSIFCGFESIRTAASPNPGPDTFYRAALLIVFAMFFDMLDGRVARMTKTQSAFGLQIDSLADVVSFGAAPALLAFQWSLHRFETLGVFAAFCFVACGAIRLARFNVLSTDEAGKPAKPSKYIVGLPIPGAAGILVAMVIANHSISGPLGTAAYGWLVLSVMLCLSFFMVSTIRFRSFKELRGNLRTILLLVFAMCSAVIVAIRFSPAFMLLWLCGLYVALGIVETLVALPERVRRFLSEDPSAPPQP